MGFTVKFREMIKKGASIISEATTDEEETETNSTSCSSEFSSNEALEQIANFDESEEREPHEVLEDRPRIEECRPEGRFSSNLRASVSRARDLSVSVSELVLATQQDEKALPARSRCNTDEENFVPTADGEAMRPESYPPISRFGTVCFFDWDDTLLPTTAAVVGGWSASPDPAQIPMLTEHASLVRDLLREASSVGQVAIVTLAKRPWVEFTASSYLPGVDWEAEFRELGIPIIYAREVVQGARYPRAWNRVHHALQEEGTDLFVRCKTNAMSKALRRLRQRAGAVAESPAASDNFNLLSIGDSRVEADSVKELAWGMRAGDNQCKAVKLRDESSTIEDLSSQLRELLGLVRPMASVTADFDLTLEEARCDDSILRHCPPASHPK